MGCWIAWRRRTRKSWRPPFRAYGAARSKICASICGDGSSTPRPKPEGWIPAHFEFSFGTEAREYARSGEHARTRSRAGQWRAPARRHRPGRKASRARHAAHHRSQDRQTAATDAEVCRWRGIICSRWPTPWRPKACWARTRSEPLCPIAPQRGDYQEIPFDVTPSTRAFFKHAMSLIDGEIDRGFLPAAPQAGACAYVRLPAGLRPQRRAAHRAQAAGRVGCLASAAEYPMIPGDPDRRRGRPRTHSQFARRKPDRGSLGRHGQDHRADPAHRARAGQRHAGRTDRRRHLHPQSRRRTEDPAARGTRQSARRVRRCGGTRASGRRAGAPGRSGHRHHSRLLRADPARASGGSARRSGLRGTDRAGSRPAVRTRLRSVVPAQVGCADPALRRALARLAWREPWQADASHRSSR